MEKLAAIWNLFRKGECVSNPAAWKAGQVTATALGAVIVAAVHVLATFGINLPIDTNSADALAGGILVVVNVVLTFATTDKIGLLPAKQPSVQADQGIAGQRITEDDVQSGIDFANQANPRRGQNIE